MGNNENYIPLRESSTNSLDDLEQNEDDSIGGKTSSDITSSYLLALTSSVAGQVMVVPLLRTLRMITFNADYK